MGPANIYKSFKKSHSFTPIQKKKSHLAAENNKNTAEEIDVFVDPKTSNYPYQNNQNNRSYKHGNQQKSQIKDFKAFGDPNDRENQDLQENQNLGDNDNNNTKNFVAYEKTNIQKLTQTYLYTIDNKEIRKLFKTSTPKHSENNLDASINTTVESTNTKRTNITSLVPTPSPQLNVNNSSKNMNYWQNNNNNNNNPNFSALESTILKQENELNIIRNALIKSEQDRFALNNKLNQALHVQNSDKDVNDNSKFGKLVSSQADNFLANSPRDIKRSFSSHDFRVARNKPYPENNNNTNNTNNLLPIKSAKTKKISLIKSRPVIEHLTESYKKSSLLNSHSKSTKNELENDLLYKESIIDRYKAQNELCKINLQDSQKLNEKLDEKLAQEECNRLLLTHSLNLCNLRAKLYDLTQLVEEIRLQAVLGKLKEKESRRREKSKEREKQNVKVQRGLNQSKSTNDSSDGFKFTEYVRHHRSTSQITESHPASNLLLAKIGQTDDDFNKLNSMKLENNNNNPNNNSNNNNNNYPNYKIQLKSVFTSLMILVEEINNKITDKCLLPGSNENIILSSSTSKDLEPNFKNFNLVVYEVKMALNKEIIKLEKLVQIPQKDNDNELRLQRDKLRNNSNSQASQYSNSFNSPLDKNSSGGLPNNNIANNNNKLELAVLYEEITLLKEQIALSNTKEGKNIAANSATFEDLKAIEFDNENSKNYRKMTNQQLQDIIFEKNNLLAQAKDREEKFKEDVYDLKVALKRLQARSEEQKGFSERFIRELKRENQILIDSLKNVQ